MHSIPPIKKYGTKNKPVYIQAQQAWLILVAHVMAGPKRPKTITYGELAEKMGYESRRAAISLGRPLGVIGEYCRLNDLPTLNSIVVNDWTGDPGTGVLVRDGYEGKIPKEQRDVYKVNWFNFRVPTTGTLRKVWETF